MCNILTVGKGQTSQRIRLHGHFHKTSDLKVTITQLSGSENTEIENSRNRNSDNYTILNHSFASKKQRSTFMQKGKLNCKLAFMFLMLV